MNNRIISAVLFLLTLVSQMSAEEKVTIEDFIISAGETKELSITLENEVAYAAFQFNLYLPKGLTVSEYSKDEDRIPEGTTLSMSQLKDGSYRFVAVPMNTNNIVGESGRIATIKVTADKDLTNGSLTGYFRKVKLSKLDGTGVTYDEMAFPITVLKPSTVTAKSYERVYGEVNPVFDFDVAGGVLDGVPEITCEATETSPVGTYDIIIKRGTETNYNVTYVHGTLTIKKAPLTITAKDYTIKQGEVLPTFEATYDGFKNNETEAVLTKKPTITTTATSVSEPGEYDITVSGAEAKNYEISYAKGKLTITEADPVTITAKSYTIKYGDDLPTFEYTSKGAKLSGTPSITCEATKTSPVGTYPIVITKGSVTNYNVTYVNGTLTIEKAPLKITAKDYTIKQGEVLPTFEATYEGFKNDETEAVLTKKPTIITTATSASEPGEYDIIVSDAEAKNYEISYAKGKLTITEADPVTITAKSYTIKYGDEIPAFEFTNEGATLNGTPSITCEATKTSSVGTYPIVISKGTVKNFNDTYVNGTLTIEKAPLTITAKDYTIKQGQPLPEFEATYEGFKNNETKDVLTKQPTITTTATSASEPGEYDITISGAEAKNYEISYAKGKLTITEADPVTITAKSYTIKYGDEIPAFEFTNEGATLNGTPSITCEATSTSPVGTYPIVISKGTVKNYNDTYVNGTLTIEKAPLKITAKDYTIKQGEVLPTFEATYEGFKNDETEAVLTKKPTITTTATSASEPGEYDITVSSAEAQNYDISYAKGKLTIVDADALIITAKSYTIKYGDDLPTFEYTSDGAALEGTPSITCEATKTSPVGTYPIVISKGSVSNYNVTYVNGTLTINKAALSIKADSKKKLYCEQNPELTYSCEGFVKNETDAVLSTKPQLSTTAITNSAVGVYPIEISGAEATNYSISYQNAELEIQKRTLTASAKNYTRAYGEENPVFEIQYSGFVNDEDENVLTAKPKATTEATSTSDVGEYSIVVDNGVAENYDFIYNNGILTIEKAYQTLTWEQDFSDVNQYDQIELIATASSGLAVTYIVEGDPICSIVKIGNKYYLDCTDVGETVIVAIQEGNKNYWQSTKINKPIVIKGSSNYINGHEYVDLGLPSGKLWAKTNMGSTSETGYGNYVDWSENDIVTTSWGSDWGTPNYSDYEELINSCSWTWSTKNGVNGYIVEGPNGNSIFFPAAGFRIMNGPTQMEGEGIYYWTNSLLPADNSFAYMLSGNSSSITSYATFNITLMSAPIRPIVITQSSGIKGIIVDDKELNIYNLDGSKRNQLHKGINIVKMNDGKTKKVFVK